MEIQDLLLDKYHYKTIIEIKKLLFIEKQNNTVLEKLKQSSQLYNDIIELLLSQINEKKSEMEKLEDLFVENNKHFKYIMVNLL